MTDSPKKTLSPEVRDKIDQWLLRYPADQKQSAVLQALHFAQDANQGWLSEDILQAVADYLGMPAIAVYEVATFYSMYHLQPVGRHVIQVCTNISCLLHDADALLKHIENRLQIKPNETTPDGRFTLKEVECLAACAAAPVCQIGKRYHEHLTPEKIDAILAELE